MDTIRPHAVSEDIAPLGTSELDAEEQETFETGVGLVEPVEEDEAEVRHVLSQCRSSAACIMHMHAMTFGSFNDL